MLLNFNERATKLALVTTIRWIVDAVRLIVCWEWRLRHGWCCWCINTDKLLSSVKLYHCCLLAWYDYWRLSGWAYVLWCPSSSCAVFQLYFIWSEMHCLLNCALFWSIRALRSALPSTLYSNHALSNLRTAWQYSQMSYRMLHYVDFVNSLWSLASWQHKCCLGLASTLWYLTSVLPPLYGYCLGLASVSMSWPRNCLSLGSSDWLIDWLLYGTSAQQGY